MKAYKCSVTTIRQCHDSSRYGGDQESSDGKELGFGEHDGIFKVRRKYGSTCDAVGSFL